MKVEEMTDDEINEVICEFMGWEWDDSMGWVVIPKGQTEEGQIVTNFSLSPPTKSLDTMSIIEQEIEERGLHVEYICCLRRMTKKQTTYLREEFALATKPPQTRAKAAVRAIKESEEEL